MSSKILIVEDNQDTRDLIHVYFKNAELSVVTAVDGSEGIYMTKAEKPDLIITDLAMPNLDGLEMIKNLRSDPDTASIPIIVFTAHGSVSPEKATNCGADKVFYKPFDFDDLVAVVRTLIH